MVKRAQWLKLTLLLGVIGVTWLVVLPSIANESHVRRHIELQERLEIDPSALFYSELKIAPAIAHRVEQLNEARPTAFWSLESVAK
jgi:hypothetical protein